MPLSIRWARMKCSIPGFPPARSEISSSIRCLTRPANATSGPRPAADVTPGGEIAAEPKCNASGGGRRLGLRIVDDDLVPAARFGQVQRAIGGLDQPFR